MKCYRAAVVGLGAIGQGYDYDSKDLILTHARALAQHPGFDLCAGVDPDARQRERFNRQYHLPAYADCASMLAAVHPEMIALAAPTALHAITLREVLSARPLAVLCEKPLAAERSGAIDMVRSAANAGSALAVNYVRRFDPGVLQMKQAIEAGRFGTIRKGVAWYSKGLRHSGTHLVDLLRFLLGEADEISMQDQGRKWQGTDPEPDFAIRFGAAKVYFLAGQEEEYSECRFELAASSGRLVYADNGSEVYGSGILDDQKTSGYRQLDPRRQQFASDTGRYQWHVVAALHRHLQTGAVFHADGASALATQELIEDVIRLCEPATI